MDTDPLVIDYPLGTIEFHDERERVARGEYESPGVVASVAIGRPDSCWGERLTYQDVRQVRDWCDALLKDIQSAPGGFYSLFAKREEATDAS